MGQEAVELPVGLDFKTFSPVGPSVRTTLGWTDQHKVVGYVGRLTRLKGVDVLAEAFHQVASANPEARLIVVGGGEEDQSMRHVLREEIAADKVHVVPTLGPEELAGWYRAMDVFVLPSRYENFSNALLEAAACGVPFIATDVGGNRILHESGAGLLFTTGSVTDLVRQLQEFFKDREPKRARALLFSKAVREKYDWDASADAMEAILKSQCVPKGRVSKAQREKSFSA
jgi:glycosyltransferase involved in cell wall biosynthesis